MGLNKAGLKVSLEASVNNLFSDNTRTPAQAATKFATDVSDAIDVFVKTATVTVPGTGLMAGSDPVTGTSITGNLS